jgi:hypothetical protein
MKKAVIGGIAVLASSAVFAMLGTGNANASVSVAQVSQQTQTVSPKLITLAEHMSKVVHGLGDDAKQLRTQKDATALPDLRANLTSLKSLVGETKSQTVATGKFSAKVESKTTELAAATAKGLDVLAQTERAGTFVAHDATGDALAAPLKHFTDLLTLLINALVQILGAVLGLVMGLPSLLGPVVAIASGALGSATGAVKA